MVPRIEHGLSHLHHPSGFGVTGLPANDCQGRRGRPW